MNPLFLLVAGATILANAGAAFADFARADFVLRTSSEVGVSQKWIPLLGALKGAAAIGLLLAFLRIPYIGTVSACGLVAFFVGAIVFHIRAHVFYNIGFPAFYLALAAGSLALSLR